MGKLFCLFAVATLTELWVLISVGQIIGGASTLVLVILTALIGAVLLRHQGLATLLRARQGLQSGQIPAREILEAVLLAFGGGLLLTPGFITDAVGFMILLPLVRIWLVSRLLASFLPSKSRSKPFAGHSDGGVFHKTGSEDQGIYEGEYSREDKV